MNMREELINNLKKYFKVQELVCPHCYNKFGENSWQFLSTELLEVLYTLRVEVFNRPMVINTYHNSGQFSQRGLRCNMCQLVKNKNSVYLSAHCLGKAIDFNVPGLSNEQVHNSIKQNIDKFKQGIRLESIESAPTWRHIDVLPVLNNSNKLIIFKG